VNAANTYFYTYIFEDLTLASIITLITCVAVFPATMVIGNLIGRFGKKKMYAIGLALAGLAPIIRLLDVRSIPLLIVSVLIAGIGAGFAAPLNYGIQADKWQKVRGEGIIIENGIKRTVEIHWYEADGEKIKIKVKRYLDES